MTNTKGFSPSPASSLPSFSSNASSPIGSKPTETKYFRRFIADACAGAAFFVLVTTLVAGTDSIAATLHLAETSEASAALALAQSSGNEHSILVLGLVFSILFAFNAAFFRHLGRAYSAAPRNRS